MLRIYRCKASELNAKVKEYSFVANDWEKEISLNFPLEYVSIIAKPVLDGENVNFVTPLSGDVTPITSENESSYKSILDPFNAKREELYNFLASDKPLKNTNLQGSRELVAFIVGHSEKSFLVKGEHIVNVPVTLQHVPAWERVAPVVAPIPPVKKGGCLLPFLLMLLFLLLLLAALWWFFLRPWPFATDPFANLFNKTPVESSKVVEEPKSDIQSRIGDDILKAEEAAKDQAEADRLKAEEEAKAKAEADRLKAEEEAKAQAEAARLKAEEEAKAQAEAARLKAEEAKKAAAAKVAKEAAAKEAAAKAKAEKEANAKKIPKCKTLQEQGKMPQMAIAFDGSESMMLPYGYTNRIKAAKSATTDLVRTIDKNVQIGLVEINGCSSAKNRGFFAPSNRAGLLGAINNINPYAYDGKTPLVNGLNELSHMLDGVNNEAVVILISDGEDTCPFTANMDVCTVASRIHQRQPKLKIHTILIGDSIDSAACIARNTGGKVFKPKDASQIDAQLKQAGATLKKVCED